VARAEGRRWRRGGGEVAELEVDANQSSERENKTAAAEWAEWISGEQ